MSFTAVDPRDSGRAEAYALWMDAPNPMVTFLQTLDVAPIRRYARRYGFRFNALLCWCVGKAASEVPEFYTLPVGRELLRYDSLAVNTIVKNRRGQVSSCDVRTSPASTGTICASPGRWRRLARITTGRRAWLSAPPPLWRRSWTGPLA